MTSKTQYTLDDLQNIADVLAAQGFHPDLVNAVIDAARAAPEMAEALAALMYIVSPSADYMQPYWSDHRSEKSETYRKGMLALSHALGNSDVALAKIRGE